MAMAITMKQFLTSNDVDYEEVHHPRAVTASQVAQQAHIPGDRVAKAVLVNGQSGYRVAVMPSTCRADLEELSRLLKEPVNLASEEEIGQHFNDCDTGALPPVGQAYGLSVCYDDMLESQPDIYFEAGDHETLVHLSGNEFRRLMAEAQHGQFSRHR